MGPLALCDLIGLELPTASDDALYEEFERDEYAPPPLMKRMVAAGASRPQNGAGFYNYSPAEGADSGPGREEAVGAPHP